MPRYVFISYAHEDQAIAETVCRMLEAAEITCWISSRDELPGEKWAEMIVRGLEESEIVVFILSTYSNDSDACEKELALANQKRKNIIPLRVEDVAMSDELQYRLAGQQRLDALPPPIEDHLGRLVTAVRNLLQSSGPKKGEQPFQREQLPPEPPREEPPSLVKILPGVWQIQVTQQLSGMMGQGVLELFPSGTFQGQLSAPTGQFMIQGMWQITPLNQLALQGQQSNGFIMVPYGFVLQFNKVTSNQLSGFTNVGEQVVFQKVR